jgi:iron-sulfur cluster repair protein YtfE (RIC family)
MLLKIGKKNDSPNLDDRLVDCHARIRHFLSTARKLAERPGAPDDQLREAASGVQRYFTEALPRHVADEDESITPKLRGRDADVDAALARMHEEHERHEPIFARLVELCAAIAESPARAKELAPELDELSATAEREMLSHLELEERVVIPALVRLMTPAERDQIIAEMNARRPGRG